ncbi:hypothetical protein Tco_1542772, partial [Tanacetum coccineum]
MLLGAERVRRKNACRDVVDYEVGSLGSLQPPSMAQSCKLQFPLLDRKAKIDYSLDVYEGKVVLALANPSDPLQ